MKCLLGLCDALLSQRLISQGGIDTHSVILAGVLNGGSTIFKFDLIFGNIMLRLSVPHQNEFHSK